MSNYRDLQYVPDGKFQDQSQVQAVVQKPVKYIENVWGQAIRTDPRNKSYQVQQSFLPQTYGKERMNTGSLPFNTSPKLRRQVTDRMIPEGTKMMWSRSCWNECLNNAGPWYLRHWQIWDYAPFLPTNGDVSLDPRYGMDTKKFTESYKVSRGQIPKRY